MKKLLICAVLLCCSIVILNGCRPGANSSWSLTKSCEEVGKKPKKIPQSDGTVLLTCE